MKRVLVVLCVLALVAGVAGCMVADQYAFCGPSPAALEAAGKAGLTSLAVTYNVYSAGDIAISNSQAKPIDAGNGNDLAYSTAGAVLGAGVGGVAGDPVDGLLIGAGAGAAAAKAKTALSPPKPPVRQWIVIPMQ